MTATPTALDTYVACGVRLTHKGTDVLWEVDEDRKAKNQQRASRLHLPACEHCGNPVKAGTGWLLMVADGGSALVHAEDAAKAEELQTGEHPEVDPPHALAHFRAGWMGSYLVGPQCGRKFPAAFRTKDTGDVAHGEDGKVRRGY
jgi:hypothetical protein